MNQEEDIFEHIQIIALNNFLHPDENSFYRKLCRWFSHEFNTSIFEVEKKPLEYLLLHYSEHRLDGMAKEELEKFKRFITKKEEVVSEEDQDEMFAEQLELSYIKQKQAELSKQVLNKQLPPDIKIQF